MHEEDIYTWDAHSDQPHVIRNKKAKRRLYLQGAMGSLKTLLTSLALPLLAPRLLFNAGAKQGQPIDGLGLCVNVDTPLDEKYAATNTELLQMVDELAVNNLLIRLPLADIENIDRYLEFIALFEHQEIVINILQDRRHIESPAMLRESLDLVFSALQHRVNYFQLGNAVNRRKWAFVSLDEYFNFFAVAEQLRNTNYPQLKLVGGCIIDFELPNFARSVLHGRSISYDATAALLYVDRRGAPENRQLGCDLPGKINWFYQLVNTSNKSGQQLWITETNWPLEGTEPFAPAVGDCMVDEQRQAAYLARYFMLVIASGRVEKCFWHQLIAPGYGLVDNRGDALRKRDAYFAFKTLLHLFAGATVNSFRQSQRGVYWLRASNAHGEVAACWCNGKAEQINHGGMLYSLDLTGKHCERLRSGSIRANDEVVYLLDYQPKEFSNAQ